MGKSTSQWQRKSTDAFWGKISPQDHILRIYESDDMLIGYVSAGIRKDDAVVVIATPDQLVTPTPAGGCRVVTAGDITDERLVKKVVA